MKIKANLNVITALIVMFGIVGSAGSAPNDSQRLRGLGDRVFLVNVELTSDPFGIFFGLFGLPVGTTFPNCYIFTAEVDDDGNNWFETAFPDTTGFWVQGSVGAKTDYVANLGPFTQLGQVTPARGKGVLQLRAETFIPETIEFLSVGEEIDASEMEELCPTALIPTLPDPD